MRSGKAFRRQKTNLAQSLAGVTTMNASGTFQIPYGAKGVLIGGRGATGNSGSGGNYASGGNLSYNPTYESGNSYTDYWDSTNQWHVYSNTDHPWGPALNAPAPYSYSANGNYPGYSTVSFNVDAYYPGNAYYNPTYYNPYFSGNAGAAANIGGVNFPGGSAGSLAPVVSSTLSTFKYQQTTISITVPAGGYVTLQPI